MSAKAFGRSAVNATQAAGYLNGRNIEVVKPDQATMGGPPASSLKGSDGSSNIKKPVAGERFVREAFDPAGKGSIHTLSATESCLRLGNTAVVFWTAGPRKGDIYQVLTRTETPLLKTKDEFFREVDHRIAELDKMVAQYEKLSGEVDNSRGPEKEKAQQEIYKLAPKTKALWAELEVYVRQAADGDLTHSGFRHHRLYDDSMADLLQSIESAESVQGWLSNRAESLGYTGAAEKISPCQPQEIPMAIDQHYKSGRGPLESFSTRNTFLDAKDPIRLLHGTWDLILPSLINEGALKAAKALHSDIPKITGENRNSRGYTPNEVSFNETKPGEAASIFGGWGLQHGVEHPIGLGMSVERASKYEVTPGSMDNFGEMTISWEVPLSDITHCFVPYFMVEEVKALFEAHGYDEMKVLPLGFRDNQPLWQYDPRD